MLDKIGHGGMGVVYSAYDPELDRRVALKLLAPGRSDPTIRSSDRGRLLREAQAMAKLTHPHVVSVYDAGTFEGSVFLTMDFVEGGTLGARMLEQPPWRSLLPLLLDAGRGRAAAHAAGLVHRDFKPDNVLLTPDGVAKVSDFGLARASTTTGAGTRFDDAEPLVERLCTHAEQTRSTEPGDWVQCLELRASVLAGRGRNAEATGAGHRPAARGGAGGRCPRSSRCARRPRISAVATSSTGATRGGGSQRSSPPRGRKDTLTSRGAAA